MTDREREIREAESFLRSTLCGIRYGPERLEVLLSELARLRAELQAAQASAMDDVRARDREIAILRSELIAARKPIERTTCDDRP